jgi:hypothetical protein
MIGVALQKNKLFVDFEFTTRDWSYGKEKIICTAD